LKGCQDLIQDAQFGKKGSGTIFGAINTTLKEQKCV
jgi:hypothetical protein